LNDPEVYHNPREFNPDRFIATPERPAEPNPREAAFGFGRRCARRLAFPALRTHVRCRICPGMNLGDAATWLEIALSASVLNVSRARDEAGNEIIPEAKYDDGLIMCVSLCIGRSVLLTDGLSLQAASALSDRDQGAR
jgi:hypothetical protein